MDKINVLVVGCGNMGTSHARAYHKLECFNIVGLVSRGAESRGRLCEELGGAVPTFGDYKEALEATHPDAVSINTYQGTHAEYAIMGLEQGAHVFVEKPLAETVSEAEQVVQAARKADKKLVVGYILRHHPGWKQFVGQTHELGKPLVMRMNLNQQSTGPQWQTHKNLMTSMSPIVDCGVHYIDMMCQMSRARPTHVHAIGARLTEEIDPEMYNYGQLQVTFDDGSVGWYESGWGPMMSEEAYFIKDVIGPEGSVSVRKNTFEAPAGSSADIEEHTQVHSLLRHYVNGGQEGEGAVRDEVMETPPEPGHDELCFYEQQYFLEAIREDRDLSDHMAAAVQTLAVVLACDESVRTGKKVALDS